MLICCTKKLSEEAQIVREKVPEEKDIFCYSAHFITINRRKVVVVVNDSSRYGFVLYGLKAKDFKRLDELILHGIKSSLKSMKIKEEVIELYLKAAGQLAFTKTRGPKYVGRLNNACERVNICNDKFDSKVIYQYIASKMMNEDIIRFHDTKDYKYVYELLIDDLNNFAGLNIIKCEAVDLIIKLDLGSHKTWRRLIVPNDITFKQFHLVLQRAFNWDNNHCYDFNIFDENGKRIFKVRDNDEIYEFEKEDKLLLDPDTKILDFVKNEYKITYVYDFGDNWEHEIVTQGTIYDYDKNYPTCIMGEGITPPEDIGGIQGYEEFLKIMSDPNNNGYERACAWAEDQGYKEFDIELVNRKLRSALKLTLY